MKFFWLVLSLSMKLWANAYSFISYRFNDSKYLNPTLKALFKMFDYVSNHGGKGISLKKMMSPFPIIKNDPKVYESLPLRAIKFQRNYV